MTVSPYSSVEIKRTAAHFFTGKVASALLTLITLLWLVRLLAAEEYGAYVVLVAGMEFTLAITTLGLPWVAARYLPEFRLYANGRMLKYFVWQVVIRISLSLFIGALLLMLTMPWLLLPLEFTQHTNVARLYLLVLLVEGSGRHIRESILGPLMQQGQAQISQVLRNLVLLLIVGIIVAQGAIDLHHVVLAELIASVLSTALTLYRLIRYLHLHLNSPGQDGWQPPNWSEMWRIACYTYFSNLVTQAYSPQVFVFLIQHYLGVEATALFGFLRNLYGQIANYLPATSYVGAGGMAELARNANLVGKLSLFALMPILVFVWLAGNELPSLLSGGKFNQANYCLAGLLLALIPFSQRQILEIVAVVSKNSHLCSWGASLGVLVLPLAYLLLESGQGLWSIIIAIIVSQILFNTMLITALTRITSYRLDAIGFFKLIAAAFAAFVLAQQLVFSIQTWLDLLVVAIFSCSLFLLVSYFIKPFRADERARVNRLFNRKIFVW